MARAQRVQSHQARDVHTRDGGRRHLPAGRDGPVPAVDEAGGAIAETRGLSGAVEGPEGLDEARAGALVVAEAVDVDLVRNEGRRIDLEVDGAALVDGHIRREALDRRVSRRGGAVGTRSILPRTRAVPTGDFKRWRSFHS